MDRSVSIMALVLIGLTGRWGLAQEAKPIPAAGQPPGKVEAEMALRKAVGFFRDQVARHGGYLWAYSGDLTLAEGEGRVEGKETIWVQPPGTPTVGLAYLDAHEATNDPEFLRAARETAHALIKGQLRSGGWTYRIEFDPAERKRYAYRVEGHPKGRNVTSLDDNTTQEAIRFLVRLDLALGREDEAIHEAAEYALTRLLQAQYPNGAWPQGFDKPAAPDTFPIKKASYPETWPRSPQRKDYWTYPTLNDNSLADTIDVLLLAGRLYRDDRYRAAALRAGDFLILAQMPDPQPAWAQQYDPDMQPTWARKFEPPAITGGESQTALETLLRLYRATGERRYLEPVPRALAYLKKSLLPDGRLARFYELKTNTPLCFNKKYELTYSADDLPTHYGFLVESRLEAIEAEYRRLQEAGPSDEPGPRPRPARVRAIIDGLDERGAWVEKGRLRFHKVEPGSGVISSRTFVNHVQVLSRFLAADR